MNKDQILCCLCETNVERSGWGIHHCHLTGEVFGVADPRCNLRAKTTGFLPIFFRGLSRYDAHEIIKYLKRNKFEKLSAIAKNDETYISFPLDVPIERFKSKSGQHAVLYHSLRFLDSFHFMSQGFDSLAKLMTKETSNCWEQASQPLESQNSKKVLLVQFSRLFWKIQKISSTSWTSLVQQFNRINWHYKRTAYLCLESS